MLAVTELQLAAFDVIAKYFHEFGRSPSLGEIASALDKKSKVQAYKLVDGLIRKGYVTRSRNQGRGLLIVKRPENAMSPSNGERITGTPHDLAVQAAYARGVLAGRTQALDHPSKIEAMALQREFERGYKKAKSEMPKNHADAFDTGYALGVKKGREEAKKDLQFLNTYAD